MGSFICNKCRSCGKFPFCNDGNCGEYIKSKGRTVERLDKENENNICRRHSY